MVLTALLLLASVAAGRKATGQDQTPQSLGSITRVGGVFVNGNAVSAAEATIFAGDTLRTAEDGVASFTASGRGTLKISPNTFVVFAGTEQYVADLRSGTMVVSSFSGPSGLTVRVGDYLAVPAVQDVQTTAKLERALAGTASVVCMEGSVSVISLQGASGLLLQAGQSSAISATGELSAASAPGLPPPAAAPSIPPTAAPTEAKTEPEIPANVPPAPAPPPPQNKKSNKKTWIIVGVAAGAAGIAAAAAAAGGGHQPVSPSSP